MTKEQFKQLGLTDEQAEKAAKQSEEELKEYVPKNRFEEVNKENKTLKTTLKENETSLEELKKSAGSNKELTAQIEKLQSEAKEVEQKHADELKEMRLNSAIKIAIGGRVQDEDIVSGLINKEKLVIGEDGKVIGLDEQIKSLKESKAFLFKEEKQQEQQRGFYKVGAEPQADTGNQNRAVSLKDAVAGYFQKNK